MLRRFDLRLQTFILVVVAPTLMVATLLWSYFFYWCLHETIVDGFDRKLHAISGITGTFIDGDLHATVLESRDESTEAYARLVAPMREILRQSGLTYVYSQVLLGEPECMYVLDATEGEDHSEIGYVDVLPREDYAGAQAVLNGGIHVGGIQKTDHWGLIKVSYAPIYDSKGAIRAMSGADVNVDVITTKTRVALLAAFGLGAFALSLGAYASVAISNRLTVPLMLLKEGALKVAAGRHGHHIEVRQPREFSLLAGDFNRISDEMSATLETRRGDVASAMEERARAARIETLAGRFPVPLFDSAGQRPVVLTLLEGIAKNRKTTASGWVAAGGELVAWFGIPMGDAAQALELRAAAAEAVQRILLDGCGVDGETREIAEVLRHQMKGFVRHVPNDGSVWVYPLGDLKLWRYAHGKLSVETVDVPCRLSGIEARAVLLTDAADSLSDVFLRKFSEAAAARTIEEWRLRMRALVSQTKVDHETFVFAALTARNQGGRLHADRSAIQSTTV